MDTKRTKKIDSEQTFGLFELAAKHVSIRQFRSDPIEDKLLLEILQCGLRSSSSGNMQSWSVIQTTQSDQKERLFQYHLKQPMILQAPVILTFCADIYRMRRWLKLRNAKDGFDDLSGFLVAALDATIAAQSIALAAESQGLGICYMGTTLWCANDLIREFQLPKGVMPVTTLVMGYPAESPALRDRLPLDSLVHEGSYQIHSDAEILDIYRDREIKGWKRYEDHAGKEFMELLRQKGIENLAQFYTSEFKYSKEQFAKFAVDYQRALEEQGFWNF
jgi:nitroreductase